MMSMLLTSEVLKDPSTWLESAATDGSIALIDKEENWTSFDCVAKMRGLTKIKKVGHAGTLDPLATGLLVLCFGKATKTIDQIQGAEKEYTTVVKLGATTATDDRGSDEHVHENAQAVPSLDETKITSAIGTFVGEIEQFPPSFAAIRHGGRRQYDLAREGKEFTPRLRQVTVHAIRDIKIDLPFIHMTIACSKGTYIRSIARDLGALLGVGGYVWSLRRTKIGAYSVDDAVTIGQCREVLGRPVESKTI